MGKKVYALYKGDSFITLGTYNEISKETGISSRSLYDIKSNRNHRQKIGIKTAERNGFVLIEVEDVENEEVEEAKE